jgi:hypothetical protein
MAKKSNGTPKETIFTVSLTKGLANRNRLPLQHVIEILKEIQDAIRAVGRLVQKERGVENPDGDFGIELLATSEGIVFRKGSVEAQAAITRDIANGAEAFRRLMQATDAIEKKKPASIGSAGEVAVPRLAAVAEIQKLDRTEMRLALAEPGKRQTAVSFGDSGINTIESISSSESQILGLTLHGRLRLLRDRSNLEEGGRYFWGELLADGGDIWRIRFNSIDEGRVTKLFRKRVIVEGDATYYRAGNPKLVGRFIDRDPERDYEAAFDEMYGCDADIYGKEAVAELIADYRGEG